MHQKSYQGCHTDKGSTFGQVGLLKNGECSPMQFCMEIPKLCSKSAKRFLGTRKSVPKIDTGFALSDLRRCQQPLPIGGVAQWQVSQLSRYDAGGSIPPAVMLLLPILPFCFASSRLLSPHRLQTGAGGSRPGGGSEEGARVSVGVSGRLPGVLQEGRKRGAQKVQYAREMTFRMLSLWCTTKGMS